MQEPRGLPTAAPMDRVQALSGEADAAERSAVRWVQQARYLWVGSRDGVCVGTIERGRVYRFLGTEGVAECAHRTLADAQIAHASVAQRCDAPPPAGRGSALALLWSAAVLMTVLFAVTAAVVLRLAG